MNKVFIGIPTVDGNINAELAMRLIQWSHAYPNIIIHHQPFLIPHDHARNALALTFLQSDATHFMGIDADVVPPEDAIDKMLAADKDCITAITKRFVATATGYDLIPTTYMYEHGNYNVCFNHTGQDLVQIDGCGTSCYLAKRKVFEDIKQPFKFEYDNNGLVERSEDLYFCTHMMTRGFKLWADYSIDCKHIKQIDISLLK